MIKQSTVLSAVACVGSLFCTHGGAFGASAATPALPIEALRLAHTPEGAAYSKAFEAAVAPRFVKARDEGMVRLKLHPPQQIDITFVVSARGLITDTLVPANQTLSTYIARKLIGLKTPKPPHDAYPVRLRLAQRRITLST